MLPGVRPSLGLTLLHVKKQQCAVSKVTKTAVT